MRKLLFLGALLPAALQLSFMPAPTTMEAKPYPETRTEAVSDDYFGTRVDDPYRWLEDDRSPETAAWVAAQNTLTQDYLSRIPGRDSIRERLTGLWNYPKYGIPQQVGKYYFFLENDGLQNQSVVYRQPVEGGEREVFLDPNTLSKDGTLALVDISFSLDNKYMAYAAAQAGSDWVEIRVMETATGRHTSDTVRWVKFSGAIWRGEGFYYSGYDEPDVERMFSAQTQSQKLRYHRIGNPQSKDQIVYEDPEHPLRYFNISVGRDRSYLMIFISEGTDGTEVICTDLGHIGEPFVVVYPGFDYNYELVDHLDGRAIFLTNRDSPNYRLEVVDMVQLELQPRVLVPEDPNRVLLEATFAGDNLFLNYLDKACSVVEQYDLLGRHIRTVTLPGKGTVSGFKSKVDELTTFYAYRSFTAPPAIYKYDIRKGTSTLVKQPELPFDPSLYTTDQVFFKSKDGTEVPMFLVHRRDLKRDGKNPVYLYGYGGFNISRTPEFSPQNILLLERGGIYALPNLRGGGEYGEAWHRAGMLEKKQNVFDDMIAAAEYLVAEGYTSPEHLGIAGGSNGGLLVGACMTQRPDLFAVALPAVGVMDMLRFQKFTVGWGWVVEYGSSDKAADFPYLYRYSPLHNIRKGTCYPATLITTADHDDRVVPAHSFKFAATLQAAQGCKNPTLIRIDVDAGHGAGKPTAKKIDEAADVLSFFFQNTQQK